MSSRKTGQYHITLKKNRDTYNRIDQLKCKLGKDSYEDVLDHYIPKTETEFFSMEWEIFKQGILKCIPDESPRTDFLQALEALYFVGIVNGNKVSPELINHFIEEFGSD